jgi:biopolymer transport protein ExbD
MSMRERLRRQIGIDAEISTSSTGDIAFLLIVFFMVTAVFAATKGLDLDLPEGKVPATTDGQPSVLVEILGGGNLRVDCRSMRAGRLLDYLEPKLVRNPGKPIIIYPHRGARYRDLVAVYDVLLRASERGIPQPEVQISTPGTIEDYIAIFGTDPFASHCEV